MKTINTNFKTLLKAAAIVLGIIPYAEYGLARTLPDGVIPVRVKSVGEAINIENERTYDAVLQVNEIDKEDLGDSASFRCEDANALRIWAQGTLTVANHVRRIRGICVSTNYKDVEIFAGEGYVKGSINGQQKTFTGRGDFENGLFQITLKPQGTSISSQVKKENVLCESIDYKLANCYPRERQGKIINVSIIESVSSRICIKGINWDFDPTKIWVTAGCRADFKVDILLP